MKPMERQTPTFTRKPSGAALVDYQIKALCLEGMVQPFDPELINPASLDVRLGKNLIVERPCGWQELSLDRYSEKKPYRMWPGEFLLADTDETFYIPNFIAGEFRLKSSRAREGYDNALAVWLDAGWSGSKLTLELVNNCRFHFLPLYPGKKIGQIIFWDCDEPESSYQKVGRYNFDATVMQSKG